MCRNLIKNQICHDLLSKTQKNAFLVRIFAPARVAPDVTLGMFVDLFEIFVTTQHRKTKMAGSCVER